MRKKTKNNTFFLFIVFFSFEKNIKHKSIIIFVFICYFCLVREFKKTLTVSVYFTHTAPNILTRDMLLRRTTYAQLILEAKTPLTTYLGGQDTAHNL